MAENRCVVYQGPNEVTVEDIGYPKLEVPEYVANNMGYRSTAAPHGVILRIVSTNICGSDQHMVRGRTTAPNGLVRVLYGSGIQDHAVAPIVIPRL